MTKAVIQNSILAGGAALGVYPGASVEIRTPAGGLATLWADRLAAGGQVNPFTADANGFFRVYADPGRYKITATAGAEVQIFEDVVVQTRREPEIMWDVASASADNVPPQVVTASGIPAGVAMALYSFGGHTRTRISHGGLVINASDIEVVSGEPGFVEIDYSLELQLTDGGGAAVTGDIVQAGAYLRVDGTNLSDSLTEILYRAQTGYYNSLWLRGSAVYPIAASTTYLIDLLAWMHNYTALSTPELTIGSGSTLSVRRAIDFDD